MSTDTIVKSRLINKHDIEANWLKAVNFKPLAGELIVYDIDENYPYQRIKIGDGSTLIADLPFVNIPIVDVSDEFITNDIDAFLYHNGQKNFYDDINYIVHVVNELPEVPAKDDTVMALYLIRSSRELYGYSYDEQDWISVDVPPEFTVSHESLAINPDVLYLVIRDLHESLNTDILYRSIESGNLYYIKNNHFTSLANASDIDSLRSQLAPVALSGSFNDLEFPWDVEFIFDGGDIDVTVAKLDNYYLS